MLLLCWMCCQPANIYLFKVKNRNTRRRCEICSEFTIKIPEQLHCRQSCVFIIDLTYFTPFSGVSIINFEQVKGS